MNEHKYYGIQCPECLKIAWYKDKTKANILVHKPYPHEVLADGMGQVLGIGQWKHYCVPHPEGPIKI